MRAWGEVNPKAMRVVSRILVLTASMRPLDSCTGRRGNKAAVHLADRSSDLKSASGPRCVSLSGLTIELMLVI